MDYRAYSPISPYNRAGQSESRTYAPKSRSNRGKDTAKEFLTSKNLRYIHIISAITLVIAIFLTWIRNKTFTEAEKASWSRFTPFIDWTKGNTGKATIIIIWIIFGVTAGAYAGRLYYKR